MGDEGKQSPAELTAGELADADTHGLKIVTLAPPPGSMPGAETTDGGLPGKRDPYLGATVDQRYRIETVLGEGGMGVVYRCRHQIIDKKVAMKVLRADLARDEEVTERFLNEAKAASAIGNPHIIDISDFGRFPDGSTYFVMEYLDGISLAEVIASGGPIPLARILHITHQLAEGLAAAHNAGIIHRDLKPDNVFLVPRGKERDFVKILDFGIAKVSTHGHRLTRAGTVFGTPHYMSPEQAAGAPVDHRGDVYSLGVMLYELASGRVPFDADNFMGILTQHMYRAPVPIRALVPEPPDVPPGLEAVILKCLSKRTEQRYQTMEELLEDLVRLEEGQVPSAVPDMMSRSGGFQVPADYFKTVAASMPGMVPATQRVPPPGVSWSFYAGVAGVLFAVGLVATILVLGATGTASPERAPLAATADPTPPTPPSAARSVPAGRQVIVATEPADAEVWNGDHKVGSAPVALYVPLDDALEITVRAEGHASRTERVDGSREAVVVKLARLGPPAAIRPASRPSTPVAPTTPRPRPDAGTLGGGDIVNPWGP